MAKEKNSLKDDLQNAGSVLGKYKSRIVIAIIVIAIVMTVVVLDLMEKIPKYVSLGVYGALLVAAIIIYFVAKAKNK